MTRTRTLEEDLLEILSPEAWLTADAICEHLKQVLSSRGQALAPGGPDALCCTYMGLVQLADEAWTESRAGPPGREHVKEYRLSPIGGAKKQQLLLR